MGSDVLSFTIQVNADGAQTTVAKLQNSFKGLQDVVSSIKTISLVEISHGLQQFSESMKNAVEPGIGFQQAMADLQSITSIGGKDLQDLGAQARKLGVETGRGAGAAMDAFNMLARNININTIGGAQGLKILHEATIKLAGAAGIDLPQAVETMTRTLKQFELPVTDASRLINVLAAGARAGGLAIPDLSDELIKIGPVANQAGMSLEQTVAMLDVLSAHGIQGQRTGEKLKGVLLSLQNSDIPGVDLKTQGLSGSLKALSGYLGDNATLTKIFGEQGMSLAKVLIQNASSMDGLTMKITGTRTAYEQAAIRANTYHHAIMEVKAKLDDYKIALFGVTGSTLPFLEVTSQSVATVGMMVPALNLAKQGIVYTGTSLYNLIVALKGAKTAQQALNIAFVQNPIGAVIAGIVLLGGALYMLRNRMNSVTKEEQALNDIKEKAIEYSARERIEADRLFDSLKRTNPGSKERSDIIESINQKYGPLLKNMDLEKGKAEDIASAYQKVTIEIERKARTDAAQELLAERYRAVLQQQIKADAEIKKNKASDKQLSSLIDKNGNLIVSPEAFANKTFQNPLYSESEQIKLSHLKEDLDALHFQIWDMKISDIKKGNQGVYTPPYPPDPSGDGKGSIVPNGAKEREKAQASISGDSKVMKNMTINIDSLIKENNNYLNSATGMDLEKFKDMLKSALISVLNDMNYSI